MHYAVNSAKKAMSFIFDGGVFTPGSNTESDPDDVAPSQQTDSPKASTSSISTSDSKTSTPASRVPKKQTNASPTVKTVAKNLAAAHQKVLELQTQEPEKVEVDGKVCIIDCGANCVSQYFEVLVIAAVRWNFGYVCA